MQQLHLRQEHQERDKKLNAIATEEDSKTKKKQKNDRML